MKLKEVLKTFADEYYRSLDDPVLLNETARLITEDLKRIVRGDETKKTIEERGR